MMLEVMDFMYEHHYIQLFWQKLFARKSISDILVIVEARLGMTFYMDMVVFRSNKDYYLAASSFGADECPKPKLKFSQLDSGQVRKLISHYDSSNRVFERHSSVNCCGGFIGDPSTIFFQVSSDGRSNSFFLDHVRGDWPEKFEDLFKYLDFLDKVLVPCANVDSIGSESTKVPDSSRHQEK